MAKAAFKKNILLTTKLDSNSKKKLVKGYIWRTALYDGKPWTLRSELSGKFCSEVLEGNGEDQLAQSRKE
jgi:hypothetical protein